MGRGCYPYYGPHNPVSECSDDSGADSDDDSNIGTGSEGRDAKVDRNKESESKAKLKETIDAIETHGSFSMQKQYTLYANPGIHIDGARIHLPLDESQVPVIRKASRQAPFGRGDQTFVDTSVRKTWELDASQLEFKNPAWDTFLSTVRDHVVEGLGMTDVAIEPYKLLLYEQGSFFKRHKDSEKAPGMIGTLSLCLPSSHRGGQVHLLHAGEEHVIDTGKSNPYDLHALAWYADVTHEIKPVERGNRLVMIYNIIQRSDSGPDSAASIHSQDTAVDDALSRALSIDKPRRILYYLEHKYSPANLCLAHLKGRDRAVVEILKKATVRNNCSIFLSNITKIRGDEWSSGYDYSDEGPKFVMDSIVTLDSRAIVSEVSLRRTDILGRDHYQSDRDADSQSEGEEYGNEGAPISYRYHDSAVVIVPKHQLHQFLSSARRDDQKSLYELAMADFKADVGSPIARRNLTGFMTRLVERAPDYAPVSISIARRLGNDELYDVAVRAGFKHDSLLKASIEALTTVFNAPKADIPDWDRMLGTFVECHQDLTALSKSLDSVDEKLVRDDLRVSFRSWRPKVEFSNLEHKSSLELADHDSLINLLSKRWEDQCWIKETLLPKLQFDANRHLQSKMICSLLEKERQGALPNAKEVVIAIFKADSMQSLRLQRIRFKTPGIGKEDYEESNRFLFLVDHCLMSGLEEHVDEILRLSISTVKHALLDDGSPVLSGTLQKRPDTMLAEEILYTLSEDFEKSSFTSQTAREFFLAILRKFVLRDQPVSPTKLAGHAHRARGCGQQSCKHCPELDQFLTDSDTMSTTLFKGPKICQHLAQQLPRELFTTKSVEVTKGKQKQFALTIDKLGMEYIHDLENYMSDLLRFISRVEPLRTEFMKKFLGEETYGEAVMLDKLPSVDETANELKRQRGYKEKRKAEEQLDEQEAKRRARSPSGWWHDGGPAVA
ncbi:hypothetical protein F5Y18DRAFT_307203 [Xylariaceae sp. FL1019]|nr:hypothetical protein F5Y18DRAFT_307203 [Xylariaceae sp. FL1019]